MAQEEKIIPERYKKQAKQAVEVMNCDNGLDDSAAWLIYKLICELGAAESALSARSDEMARLREALKQVLQELSASREGLADTQAWIDLEALINAALSPQESQDGEKEGRK